MLPRLVTDPLDPGALLAAVSSPRCGATSLFLGTVREVNDGRPVARLEYSAYVEMAARELAEIAREAEERFGATVVVQHRLGTLEIGEASVAIAAAAPHRGDAFDACRQVIEELKRRVPIWKREHYLDGDRAWIGDGAAPATSLLPEHSSDPRRDR